MFGREFGCFVFLVKIALHWPLQALNIELYPAEDGGWRTEEVMEERWSEAETAPETRRATRGGYGGRNVKARGFSCAYGAASGSQRTSGSSLWSAEHRFGCQNGGTPRGTVRSEAQQGGRQTVERVCPVTSPRRSLPQWNWGLARTPGGCRRAGTADARAQGCAVGRMRRWTWEVRMRGNCTATYLLQRRTGPRDVSTSSRRRSKEVDGAGRGIHSTENGVRCSYAKDFPGWGMKACNAGYDGSCCVRFRTLRGERRIAHRNLGSNWGTELETTRVLAELLVTCAEEEGTLPEGSLHWHKRRMRTAGGAGRGGTARTKSTSA
ncbi:hypothetical protein B0H17DRAFT_1146114 [Mycena rosella]|uniref:Uncharacterized protein n=1 Tax=Mycena rosella TaxID=1033263 RepID=A0AAD7G559_MYCRO|nr:hypothetical protein B0H17DRAFT_1146114 [Mycena rosella]